MKWGIVTDSSCDLFSSVDEGGQVSISSVPFVISAGDQDFIDDESLDISAMLDAIEGTKEASRSACPSPNAWFEKFKQADNIIALTISSNLSGSYNSAQIAKDMVLEKYPDKQIEVIDSLSTGPEMTLCVEEILQQIKEGAKFKEIVSQAKDFLERAQIIFALCSFDNLVKNGRIGRTSGFLAKHLHIWGIGIGSEEGTIDVVGKAHGPAKAIKKLLVDMEERGFSGGQASISHCQNQKQAATLKDRILKKWPTANISILPTRGLCSYYAERGGLIVSFVSAS